MEGGYNGFLLQWWSLLVKSRSVFELCPRSVMMSSEKKINDARSRAIPGTTNQIQKET